MIRKRASGFLPWLGVQVAAEFFIGGQEEVCLKVLAKHDNALESRVLAEDSRIVLPSWSQLLQYSLIVIVVFIVYIEEPVVYIYICLFCFDWLYNACFMADGTTTRDYVGTCPTMIVMSLVG